MSITKRLTKGSYLTYAEMDANLDHLDVYVGTTAITSADSPYTATADDGVILCTGAGVISITLPEVTENQFNRYVIIRQNGDAVITVATSGTNLIDGYAQFTVHEAVELTSITGAGYSTVSTGSTLKTTNTALGAWALDNAAGGYALRNTGLGCNALYYNTTGFYNTAVGYASGAVNTVGNLNTSIGYFAGYNYADSGIVAIGAYACYSNSNGAHNVGVGHNALYNNAGGANNTAIGEGSLFGAATVDINGNSALGRNALAICQGDNNTGIGYLALTANTTGGTNTAIGKSAMGGNTTGGTNVAVGVSALAVANTVGNTAIGYHCMYSATGAYNTAVGWNSLQGCTGASNVAIGYTAGQALTSGSSNVGVGHSAMIACTDGVGNTSIGTDSLLNLASANYNTALGYAALSGVTTETNCTGIGYTTAVTGSNQVQLGNASTTTYAYGAVQDRSDIRDKADIRDTTLGLDFINKLRPVDFKWDMREDYRTFPEQKLKDIEHTGEKTRSRYHHGLIAQEVQKLLLDSGIDFGGFQNHTLSGGDDVLTLGYVELIAPLIKAVQELSAEVQELKTKKPRKVKNEDAN